MSVPKTSRCNESHGLSTAAKNMLVSSAVSPVSNRSWELPATSGRVVSTRLGLIRGVTSPDGEYEMFMGIPYAKVQEDNPFAAAVPNPKFDGVFEANNDRAASPQEEEFTKSITGTLDCLHLNIYVPRRRTTTTQPFPVMVWIYGGRYEIGFAGTFLYGPKYFMRQQVVLVTVNYRLGPYGFLCANTAEIPGNQGLKDILIALRWVKDNIEDFGGDPKNITAFGESCGAMAIDLYMTMGEELFHKAILMSGVSTRPLTVREPDLTVPKRIAHELGLKTDSVDEAIEFIAKADPHSVIKAYLKLGIIFRPCVEKKFDYNKPLIPDFPMNLPVPDLRSMPVMIGYCDSETMFRHFLRSDEEFAEGDIFKKYLGTTFDLGKEQRSVEDIVRQFYIGDRPLSRALMWNIIDFDSDFSFVYPIQDRIKKLVEGGAEHIYQYMFTYSGSRNFVKKRLNTKEGGACHADDIAYLFDISYETTVSKSDQLMINRMTTMWANFAKYGEPIPRPSELLPEKWRPVARGRDHCLVIGDDLKAITRPLHHRMAFWKLFYKLYEKKLRFYKEL